MADNETPPPEETPQDKKEDLTLPPLEGASPAEASEGSDSLLLNKEQVTQAVGLQDISQLEAVYEVPVQISAVLGSSKMQVSQLLKLGRGAVVELDRKVGEAIDIYVNDRLVARGEVVVAEGRLGITMTEIIKSNR
jgi:flagellar motor switch protein FliN/FliY